MESASSDCSENVLMSEAKESPLIARESRCGVELSMLDVLSTLGERDSLKEGLIVSILTGMLEEDRRRLGCVL